MTDCQRTQNYRKRIVEPCLRRYRYMMEITGRSSEEISLCLKKREKDLLQSRRLEIPDVSFMVTSRCSLKCKECAALIPQLPGRTHFPLDQLVRTGDAFLDAIDKCYMLKLTGGEAFLHPDLDKLIAHFAGHEKIDSLVILTNGTVFPSKRIRDALREYRDSVILAVSHYMHAEPDSRLIPYLVKDGIDHQVHHDMSWISVGDLHPQGMSHDQLISMYGGCSKNTMCRTIFNDKFFACTFAASLHEMGISTNPDDYVDLATALTRDDLRERLHNYMLNKEYIDACDHCVISGRNRVPVEAGVQLRQKKEKAASTV